MFHSECHESSLIYFLQLSGFFKGMYYPLLSAGALNSLFFGVYGVTLRAMTENREDKSFYVANCLKELWKP